MEDLSRYYTLLRDPARRRIIEILGVQEKIGFKELKETLGLGVGTVYYHLDMLSDFVTQDRQRKYKLSDRGQTLYRILKEGNVPPAMEISGASSHRLARWLFLSSVFARTARPLRLLPISVAMLTIGALGSAYAKLDPALFFYLKDSVFTTGSIVALYFLNWIGLFLFAEIFSYIVYRRSGNSLQLFTCIGIATLPLMIFPYVYWIAPVILPNIRLSDLEMAIQGVLVVLQVWSLLLVSSAFCFGKGLRLDKAIVISLAAMYLNMAILFMMGRFA